MSDSEKPTASSGEHPVEGTTRGTVPPASPPAVAGLPPLDDRRRFRELWKELVIARLLCGALAGVVSKVAVCALPRELGWIGAGMGFFLVAMRAASIRPMELFRQKG